MKLTPERKQCLRWWCRESCHFIGFATCGLCLRAWEWESKNRSCSGRSRSRFCRSLCEPRLTCRRSKLFCRAHWFDALVLLIGWLAFLATGFHLVWMSIEERSGRGNAIFLTADEESRIVNGPPPLRPPPASSTSATGGGGGSGNTSLGDRNNSSNISSFSSFSPASLLAPSPAPPPPTPQRNLTRYPWSVPPPPSLACNWSMWLTPKEFIDRPESDQYLRSIPQREFVDVLHRITCGTAPRGRGVVPFELAGRAQQGVEHAPPCFEPCGTCDPVVHGCVGRRHCTRWCREGTPCSFVGIKEHCYGGCVQRTDRCGAEPIYPRPCLREERAYLGASALFFAVLAAAVRLTLGRGCANDDAPVRTWLFFGFFPLCVYVVVDLLLFTGCAVANHTVLTAHTAIFAVINTSTYGAGVLVLWRHRRGFAKRIYAFGQSHASNWDGGIGMLMPLGLPLIFLLIQVGQIAAFVALRRDGGPGNGDVDGHGRHDPTWHSPSYPGVVDGNICTVAEGSVYVGISALSVVVFVISSVIASSPTADAERHGATAVLCFFWFFASVPAAGICWRYGFTIAEEFLLVTVLLGGTSFLAALSLLSIRSCRRVCNAHDVARDRRLQLRKEGRGDDGHGDEPILRALPHPDQLPEGGLPGLSGAHDKALVRPRAKGRDGGFDTFSHHTIVGRGDFSESVVASSEGASKMDPLTDRGPAVDGRLRLPTILDAKVAYDEKIRDSATGKGANRNGGGDGGDTAAGEIGPDGEKRTGVVDGVAASKELADGEDEMDAEERAEEEAKEAEAKKWLQEAAKTKWEHLPPRLTTCYSIRCCGGKPWQLQTIVIVFVGCAASFVAVRWLVFLLAYLEVLNAYRPVYVGPNPPASSDTGAVAGLGSLLGRPNCSEFVHGVMSGNSSTWRETNNNGMSVVSAGVHWSNWTNLSLYGESCCDGFLLKTNDDAPTSNLTAALLRAALNCSDSSTGNRSSSSV